MHDKHNVDVLNAFILGQHNAQQTAIHKNIDNFSWNSPSKQWDDSTIVLSFQQILMELFTDNLKMLITILIKNNNHLEGTLHTKDY